MCATCGCGASDPTITDLQTGERHALGKAAAQPHRHADGTWHVHEHDHDQDHHGAQEHDHHHGHEHDQPSTTVVELNLRVLERNDRAAERNRAWLMGREVLALNLMSGPGAGKTTLLERTIADLKSRKIFVLEGDQATDRDGDRVKAAGADAVQINTGSGCHLDAEMVARGLTVLKPDTGALLFIENVGNLVCPALFDLGEHRRVAILSVTEGDDKPLKYPHMFRAADLLLLSKIDLLAHVDFDVGDAIAHAKDVNPGIEALPVSARTGEGMGAWEDWIARAQQDAAAAAFA
ncbi:hydrogenase nickel incorporation protein HypB [Phenylobacterium sp.]|jgi:hydrogenase nickel incorporation protein HypB|uniref:hydrogenase nickel incorporation protein HypB n=1 Tax=Phenylobacterium sp. TaxID=1871053 RepID=UPI002E330288|nr:hydrogenase nickel incorporation protein HypB [Phenylobacterium sp.]HEX4711184.1 hydrogenase nickel incorporation protein HypB [Phenylobacterium sp.]